MTVHETEIPGVLLVEPRVFADARGFFLERYHAERYRAHGIAAAFVQDNHSRSRRGALRGLHFQRRHPQGKLVECARGAVYDVVVDLRRGSPTFGRSYGVTLSDEDHRQLWIPPGLAHGFCVLSDEADFLYKCTDYYRPDDEGGLAWDDPDLGIAWPVEAPLLSEKDRRLPRLKDLGPGDLPVISEFGMRSAE
ncbi:MAG TPA: dTDP-4-dehydrorhamnose 3,5-epimerase [Rubricoccaceae bacterium]|nr:dTDP-4-dehydrorhamnose 3,5-epimerase [Rubricoccaceae bacterium]